MTLPPSPSPTSSSRSNTLRFSGQCSAIRVTVTAANGSRGPPPSPNTLGGPSGAAFPGADPDALSTAIWAVVHGLAFLHLDGKLDTSTPKVVADRVRAAVLALVAVSPAT